MKKIIVLLIAFAMVFASCGKKDEVKKEDKKEVVKDDILKGLFYQKELSDQINTNQANNRLTTKDEKNNCAYELDIFYKGDWKDYKQEEFKTTAEKIGKYPAIIDKSQYTIQIYVQALPGVLVCVTWKYDLLKGYDNLETMKKIASMFDYEGLEKLKGDNVSGVELAKYFPKFEHQ